MDVVPEQSALLTTAGAVELIGDLPFTFVCRKWSHCYMLGNRFAAIFMGSDQFILQLDIPAIQPE